MARPRTDIRARIVRAARARFLAAGVDGASLREIAQLAKTQQQAMQMSFFFFLPNILLSGFMFPFEAMPRPAQWLAQALPITHFLRIVRGVVLKGSSFAEMRVELVWLTSILFALIVVSSLRFRKKLI